MEPANLNSSPDARLEAALSCAMPALPDDGFSARVLAALPAPEPAKRPWRRVACCLAGAAGGGVLAWWQAATWPGSRGGFDELIMSLVNSTHLLADPVAGVALAITVLSLVFAFRIELLKKLL